MCRNLLDLKHAFWPRLEVVRTQTGFLWRRGSRKNDSRNQALAWLIKRRTVVGDEWLIMQLGISHRKNVSRAVSTFRDRFDSERNQLQRLLHICTD